MGQTFGPQIAFLNKLTIEDHKYQFEPIPNSVVVDPQAGEISMKVILSPEDLKSQITDPMTSFYRNPEVLEATLLSKM